MRTIILALGLLATPAMAADQFDLVCKGREKTSPLGRWKPYEVRYHIDLVKGVFCAWECTSTSTIASVSEARIDFAASDESRPENGAVYHYVDRSDGNWVYFISSPTGLYENAEGKCDPAPYSGLPTKKF